MNEITTTDLSKFGYREIEMTRDLLDAWIKQGLHKNFYDNEVTVMMNTHSGNVFLTNSEYQVMMMNDDKLEMFHSLPYSGEEGFAEDFQGRDKEDFHPEDWEYLINYEIVEDEQ